METELTTTHHSSPITISWEGDILETENDHGYLAYTRTETIQIRNFLNQLNLEDNE